LTSATFRSVAFHSCKLKSINAAERFSALRVPRSALHAQISDRTRTFPRELMNCKSEIVGRSREYTIY
jgi:hypothetical protein